MNFIKIEKSYYAYIEPYLQQHLYIQLSVKMKIVFPIEKISFEKRKWISLFILFMVNLLNYMDR